MESPDSLSLNLTIACRLCSFIVFIISSSHSIVTFPLSSLLFSRNAVPSYPHHPQTRDLTLISVPIFHGIYFMVEKFFHHDLSASSLPFTFGNSRFRASHKYLCFYGASTSLRQWYISTIFRVLCFWASYELLTATCIRQRLLQTPARKRVPQRPLTRFKIISFPSRKPILHTVPSSYRYSLSFKCCNETLTTEYREWNMDFL